MLTRLPAMVAGVGRRSRDGSVLAAMEDAAKSELGPIRPTSLKLFAPEVALRLRDSTSSTHSEPALEVRGARSNRN